MSSVGQSDSIPTLAKGHPLAQSAIGNEAMQWPGVNNSNALSFVPMHSMD